MKDGGILVVPVGDRSQQELMIVRRTGEEFTTENAGSCVFVPLIGREGWPS